MSIAKSVKIDNKIKSFNRSGGGIISQQLINTPTMQQKAKHQASLFGDAIIQPKANDTGLPDNLKSGIESLSGVDMSDVKVHYNSSKPAQLNAFAFAQGSDIHLASGQERHLPHEAWHVVQQKQGRVKPTKQLKSNTAINDDPQLEREADIMGAKALQMSSTDRSLVQKKAKGIIQRTSISPKEFQEYVVTGIKMDSTNKNAIKSVEEENKELEKFNALTKKDITDSKKTALDTSVNGAVTQVKKARDKKRRSKTKKPFYDAMVTDLKDDANLAQDLNDEKDSYITIKNYKEIQLNVIETERKNKEDTTKKKILELETLIREKTELIETKEAQQKKEPDAKENIDKEIDKLKEEIGRYTTNLAEEKELLLGFAKEIYRKDEKNSLLEEIKYLDEELDIKNEDFYKDNKNNNIKNDLAGLKRAGIRAFLGRHKLLLLFISAVFNLLSGISKFIAVISAFAGYLFISALGSLGNALIKFIHIWYQYRHKEDKDDEHYKKINNKFSYIENLLTAMSGVNLKDAVRTALSIFNVLKAIFSNLKIKWTKENKHPKFIKAIARFESLYSIVMIGLNSYKLIGNHKVEGGPEVLDDKVDEPKNQIINDSSKEFGKKVSNILNKISGGGGTALHFKSVIANDKAYKTYDGRKKEH